MDPLTPNKIQRLMHLAEDSSFNMVSKRQLLSEEDLKRLKSSAPLYNKESGVCESSSGLLDLDQIQGFGESDAGSIRKSVSDQCDHMLINNKINEICNKTGFHPGEITGRSTGADETVPKYRHSCYNMDALTNELNKQSHEIQDIMRHSIATNYSFHSKNLTADEASFVARNAPIPVQQTHVNFLETSTVNNSDVSVGAYFRHRCPDFGKVLAQSDSPDRSSMQPSLTEVSLKESAEPYQLYKLDPSLDCIPVRQPRNHTSDQMLGQQAPNKMASSLDKTNIQISKEELFKMPNAVSMSVNVPNLEPQKQIKSSAVPVDMRKMAAASKSTDLFVKALAQSSIKANTEKTEDSIADNSLSISKIAEFLGNQSIVRVSDIINQFSKKEQNKQPLSELNRVPKQEVPVTYLKDARNVEFAASGESVKTVISVNETNRNQENKVVPTVIVTRHSLTKGTQRVESDNGKYEHTRSKSPSTGSRSTLSTVQENCGPDSPLGSSRGEVNTSHVPSPNIEYKELDKSVDWHEVLQQKRRRQQGLAKEEWADVTTTPISGFVGVSCVASISVVTLTDSWLIATFYFDTLPNQGRDLRIDLPHQPLLLSPGKTEILQVHITSSTEMNAVLPFTVSLKDSSIDSEREFKGNLEVEFKMPVVQAMSLDGVNKLNFPPTLEKTFLTKTFVLISDSPVDLQLALSVVEGSKMFSIKNVQEIRKSEVNRVLKEHQCTVEERQASSKLKSKTLNKQLCRLTCGNAIRVTVIFEAPALSDRKNTKLETFTGAICVTLIGVETTIKTMELSGTVGTATLAFNAPENKLFLTKELNSLSVHNTGSVAGVWLIKMCDEKKMFNVSDARIELASGMSTTLSLSYTGPDDGVNSATLIFEELATGANTTLDVYGGTEKPKTFPIKTSSSTLSWIRGGRKEISLKNSTDRKVQIRCQIVGDAFTIDVPSVDARGTCCIIVFSPNECRPLPIVYSPTSYLPNAASLHLMFDKSSEYSRKINLYGCSSGDTLRWCGLATYGETALVRAVARSNIELKLNNKSPMPAFVCARVNFNLQYMCVAGSCRVEGARRVVRGRGAHAVALRVDWARVERRAQDARAPTLATLTALTGPELTRRRILRILKSECNGELDASLLPENLRMLVGPFEGEDPDMDALLADFNENRSSLVELIGGLQELKAQIDLPLDIAEDTIIVVDDTVLEHHTMYE